MNRRRSKVLYVSGTARERRAGKAVAIAILLSGACVAYSGIPKLGLRPPVVITAAFMFSIAIFLAWITAFCKSLVILDDAVILPILPTNLKPRMVVPFSEISEIRLNTGAATFKPDVEVITARGKTFKVPKTFLTNWDELYRVLTEDLKAKIRVVE